MLTRWFIAIVLAALVLSDLAIVALSFGVGGTTGPFAGIVKPLDDHRSLVIGLNAEAVRAGVHVGDIYDFRLLNLHQRAALWIDNGLVGETVDVPILRAQHVTQVHVRFLPRNTDVANRIAGIVWLTVLFLAAFVGFFICVRAKGRSSLAAGIMLFGFAVYGNRGFSHAIAPEWWRLSAEMLWAASFVVFPAAAFVMAQYCLPSTASRTLRTTLWGVFGIITTIAILDEWVEWPITLFSGHSVFGLNQYYQAPVVASFVLTLVTLAIASATARGAGAPAIRVLFVSSLVGLGAESILSLAEILSGNLGLTIPTWALYVLLLSWTLLFAGYLYAIFASRVYDVDFFISRTVIYGAVIAIVVGVLALLESGIERAALGHTENLVLSLAAPVLLGLSIRWIGQRVESLVEHTFYRYKIIAHERLRALAEDFAEAHSADGLAMRVAREIHKQFQAQAIVYRFENDGYAPCAADGIDLELLPFISQDDPVFMRLRRIRRPVDTRDFETALPFAGLSFPLIVLGRVYGAILAGTRPHDQWYDPDDQSVIANLAHELGTALLWLRSDKLPVAARIN